MVGAWRRALETEPRRKCAAAGVLAIVVLESTRALDLAIPVQVFGLAVFTKLRGRATPPYDVLLCGDVSTIPGNALGFMLGGLDDGQILSAAGVPATTALCLHVLRTDLGLAYAEAVARLLIYEPHDTSSEQQTRTASVPRRTPVPRQTDGSLAPLLHWLTEHLHEPLDLERIADRAHLSTRTLTRHFRTQTGTTPIEWILRQRVEAARSLLEDTDLTVLQVACSAGFGTAETMRRAFTRRLGISPRDYRIAIRGHSFDHSSHPARSVLQRADFTAMGRAGPVPT